MLLNSDGTLRGAIYRQHPGIVAGKHILAGVKDRQIHYTGESSIHAGAYLVDAKTGKILMNPFPPGRPRRRPSRRSRLHGHDEGWRASARCSSTPTRSPSSAAT
jgi:hypothetical protein